MKKLLLLSAATLAGASIAGASQAAVITHTFDTSVTAGTSTASGSPTVTFSDGASGTVTMTMDLTPLSSPEYIANYYFNFAGAGTTALAISHTGGTGPASSAITINPIVSNGYNSSGTNGLFDGLITFSNSNSGGGINRFNFDETLIFSLTGTGITAASFDIASAVGGGGTDTQLGQIHIQGLADGGSVNVSPGAGVPEPGALSLLGLGLFAAAGAARRRRAKVG